MPTRQDPTSSRLPIEFRKDIEGLRGIAILSVVIFHMGFDCFKSGFIGVDVFFVLSGFLITTIIDRDFVRGAFSFREFYLRRTRRILPALLVMLLFVLIAGWMFFEPKMLRTLGKNSVAAILFQANLTHFFESDYFDISAELKPLLMTWSLSIEEQFYLIWPAAFVWLKKSGRDEQQTVINLFGIFVLIAAISTLLFPSLAFYMLPSRAWELLAGVVTAVCFESWSKKIRQIRHIRAIALLILIFVLASSASSWFGHFTSQLMCITSTMLLLLQREGNRFTSFALENSLVRFFGKISYSLYLWHWPLLALMRLILPPSFQTPILTISVVAASVFISILSHRFIETPFLRMRGGTRLPAFPIFAAAGAVVAIGFTVFIGKGVPSRFQDESLELVNYIDLSPFNAKCNLDTGSTDSMWNSSCKVSHNNQPIIFMAGDSHADSIGPGIKEFATTQNFGYQQQTGWSCPFVFHDKFAKNCFEYNSKILQVIAESAAIKTVVLTGFWSSYLPNGESKTEIPAHELASALAESSRKLVNLGKNVIVLGDVLTPHFQVPTCHFVKSGIHRWFGFINTSNWCRVDLAMVNRERKEWNQALKIANWPNKGVCFRDLIDYFCRGEHCFTSLENKILYSDSHHINAAVARDLVPKLNLEFCFQAPVAH
jgi:peptidoglycan/LPS O-acetylase OafA/YrhL